MPRFYLLFSDARDADWSVVGELPTGEPITVSPSMLPELVITIARNLTGLGYIGPSVVLNTNDNGLLFTNEAE